MDASEIVEGIRFRAQVGWPTKSSSVVTLLPSAFYTTVFDRTASGHPFSLIHHALATALS